jgi:general nucleoside transport system permease protein
VTAHGIGSFLLAAVGTAAPLTVTALGGLATELAGSLSIALEGSMLVGAFAAAAIGHAAGSLFLGLAGGTAAGILLSALVAAVGIGLGADLFVAGLAANLLAPGAVSVISQAIYGTKGVLPAEAIRMGPGLALVVQGTAIAVLALFLSRSVFGLRLRAVGEGEDVARAAGILRGPYRVASLLLSGAAAGLAGAALASGIGAFVPGMTTGRGWIALVALFLGSRRPGGTVVACLALGLLFAAANLFQGLFPGGAASSAELLQALPYLAATIALAAWKAATKRKGEAA